MSQPKSESAPPADVFFFRAKQFGRDMKIKNWSKFQHFKDRRPPWIKLYRDILDDIDWHQLDPLASKVLVMCWLIASEDDGNIPDIKTLAFRLRMTEKQTSECVSKLSHWLDHDDIEVISERYQDDALETERETETKKETEKKATVVATPVGVSDSVWQDFVKLRKAKKAQITENVIERIRTEAQKAGWSLEDALRECVFRNWQAFKAEWVAEKLTASQERQNTMAQLTRGLAVPKPAKPFWEKSTDTVEIGNVEPKRLL